MPTLARLPGCTLTMYAMDHLPPHFHVRMADGREALIELGTLAILRGSLRPRERADVMAWARGNTLLLATRWKALNP
jgi:Domain of unknown function (DUF4160)